MVTIADYTILEELRSDGEFGLYRARRKADGVLVLLKTPLSPRPTPRVLGYLEHEYQLADRLDPAWALHPLALEHAPEQIVLCYENFPGMPCATRVFPMDVGPFLALALRVVTAVSEMHQQNIIHRDLKPEHVLVHPGSGEVRLTGFGIAQLQAGTVAPAQATGVLEGTIAYMSPEQTGQMVRSIDYRTDLFSLGVLFYQMLTNSLPFSGADPLEWVHSIVAQQPAPMMAVRPELPAVLSDIVLRLLAKSPEERYQTAAALLVDLEQCQAAWQAEGQIAAFTLGAHDISDRFLLSPKLYGRKRELAMLRAAYQRVASQGTPECLLVSGAPGVGKTR